MRRHCVKGCGKRAVHEHHIVPKQRIRKVHRTLAAAYRRGQGPRPWGITKALADERNLVPVCADCHGPLDIPLEAHELPFGFDDFLSEYDLRGELPRNLRSVVA